MQQVVDRTQHYDLYSTDGQFHWRNQDLGVGVKPDRLTVIRAGIWTDIPFTDIEQVTLSTATVGKSGPIAQCTLALENGSRVIVTNANANGLADGARDEAYRYFVAAFHQALIDSGAATAIRFHSGFTPGRMNGLIIALVAGTALFVVLPFFLLVLTSDLQSLWLLFGGIFLILPFWRAAKTNQPAEYRPDVPPDLLR